jgi:hypothetical protein
VTRYRKRTAEVEAERVDRDKLHRLSPEFRAAVQHDECPGVPLYENGLGQPHVHTPEGPLPVSDGDWLVKVPGGDFYPCAADLFAENYEPVTP